MGYDDDDEEEVDLFWWWSSFSLLGLPVENEQDDTVPLNGDDQRCDRSVLSALLLLLAAAMIPVEDHPQDPNDHNDAEPQQERDSPKPDDTKDERTMVYCGCWGFCCNVADSCLLSLESDKIQNNGRRERTFCVSFGSWSFDISRI